MSSSVSPSRPTASPDPDADRQASPSREVRGVLVALAVVCLLALFTSVLG
ncbi:hypothetical protein ACI2K4_04155 [Micromonospora sp. NPDC050397]